MVVITIAIMTGSQFVVVTIYTIRGNVHRNSCRVKNPIVYVKYAKSSDDCASKYLYRYLSIFHQ